MLRPSRSAGFVLLASILGGCASGAATTGPASPTGAAATVAPVPSVSPLPTATPAPATPEPTPAATATSTATAWRQLEPGSGPGAREDHTWTVDPAARVAYLFGGRDGARVEQDLWAFDLATDTWESLAAENDGPTARFGHEAVWVDGLGVVVWAGQAGPTTFFDDLWAYDPTANRWTRLPNAGATPLARYGSCAALAPDGRLWISHGFTEDGTRFADTRAYDFEAGRWTDETPDGRVPVNRCLHGCWWSDDGELVLYAGQTTGVQALGDLWRLADPGGADAAWARVEGDLPEERNLYAFARHGDSIVVFGGRGLGSTYHRDLFAIDDATLAIEPLRADGPRPPGRSGATLVDDPAGGRLVLFGGRTASRALDDTWELMLP